MKDSRLNNKSTNRSGMKLLAAPVTSWVMALMAAMCSSPVMAGAGDTANTYGLGPLNVGTAMAFSPFGSGAFAVYYNPAAMARSAEGEIIAVLQHGDQELRAKSLGGDAPLVRDNNVLNDQSSELLLFGLKTRLAGASDSIGPVYFGLNVGVDEYSGNILPFQADTSEQGQFLRYQSQPLYLAFGGAVGNLLRGVDVGLSFRLTLGANARLEAVSDLAGNTDTEKLSLEASPSLSPTVGVTLRPGEMLCGSSDCLPFGLDALETALFWRDESDFGVSVDANVVIPGVIPEPGLDLVLDTIDSYQPEVLGFGLLYPVNQLEFAASVELHRWSQLEKRFAGDTVRDQANTRFDDITIVRLGASYQWSDALKFHTGISVEDSPLKSTQSQDVNFLDSDRKIFAVGASYRFNDFPVVKQPLEFGVAYQYQQLDKAEFDLLSINSPTDPQPYERVQADGDIHVFSASASLKF
ncbi:OmpP1/FadL family transporter [Isoalcanivorax pacificus]|nr:outer membrane protein transport protein [Isoalcanivorax pacificus]